MHVAFALMLGIPMATMARRVWVKVLWLLYPALVTFVVVATANHWWFDAFAGAAAPPASPRSRRSRSPAPGPAAWAWLPPAPAAAARQAV